MAELIRGRLYAYVFRIVLHEHLAQDIVQESMLEMFKVLGKLERADRFWPWLRAISLNKVRRHYTKLKKHRRVPISSVKEPRSKPGESQAGLASLVTEELKQVVFGAMSHLKPQHRKVLTMRCYEEMEYADIAHLMGCTELSARVLFCRAKRALQKQLTREGFGRGFLVTALVLFGKITAPSEAAAASVSVTAATTKVGVAVSLVTLAGGKAAIVALTTAGVLTVGTMVATSNIGKKSVLPGGNPANSSQLTKPQGLVSKGAEEGWYYYPWNVNGPVMMRLVKWDSDGTESYCQWWQVMMAQTGSFIPAKDAQIGLVDRIFTRVGASDELVRGQSTFMVEMTETANIINNATERSLVILDEVGRGTSTYDGLSLAWAITEHIATKAKCRTLFATHYHELTELAELFKNVRNCNVAVREWADEVVFLHKILPGGTDKSYGIHVAKLAGIPKSILERSKEILEELESTFQKEAAGSHLAKHKTKQPDKDSLFVQKHKSVLEKLSSIDINNLTPIEAINLLNQIKNEIDVKGNC